MEPANYPEIAGSLTRFGIDLISVNITHAAADLTGHLDNTSIRQNLRLLAGRKLTSATQLFRQRKRKLSVLKRSFRFDDVRSLDISVGGFEGLASVISNPATPIPATSAISTTFTWVV